MLIRTLRLQVLRALNCVAARAGWRLCWGWECGKILAPCATTHLVVAAAHVVCVVVCVVLASMRCAGLTVPLLPQTWQVVCKCVWYLCWACVVLQYVHVAHNEHAKQV